MFSFHFAKTRQGFVDCDVGSDSGFNPLPHLRYSALLFPASAPANGLLVVVAKVRPLVHLYACLAILYRNVDRYIFLILERPRRCTS